MKKIIFAVLSAAFAVSLLRAVPAPVADMTYRGIQLIHSLELDEAENQFSKIVEEYPEHPYGHFGLAVVEWARLEYFYEESNPEIEALFEEKLNTALEIGKEWVKENPEDPYGHLCLGGIYGLKARLSVMLHKWLDAYFTGKKGLKQMSKALEIDPSLYDAKIGPGMYKYYAGTLSGVVGVLSKFLVRGNAQDGIDLLYEVKDRGYINATPAKLLLTEILTQTDSKYANASLALKWARELREDFPGNPMMHFVEIVCLYEDKQYSAAIEQAQDFIARIERGDKLYLPMYTARAYTAIGAAYLAEGNLDQAYSAYEKSVETITNPAMPNRWAVWSAVKMGNILDLKGERKQAKEMYKKSMDYEDLWNLKPYIKKYLKKPFKEKELPGQLPPP